MTTTRDIVTKTRSRKPYFTLEIKRRYEAGFEADWFDVSNALIDKKEPKISNTLDIDDFGWGQFKSSSANFSLNNIGGAFFPPNYPVSLFSGTIARHNTKIKYTAGYKDENGDPIEEKVFEGLLNEKTIVTNIDNGTVKITAISNDSILRDNSVGTTAFGTPATVVSSVVATIMSSPCLTEYINFDGAQITPGWDTPIDDPSKYNDAGITEIFDLLAKVSNSVWHIDVDTNKLIMKPRTSGNSISFAFVGGYSLAYETNIIDITSYSEGYGRLINRVDFFSVADHITKAGVDNIEAYGENKQDITTESIVNAITINSISNNIINEFKIPRRRIAVKTSYMPNILELFDVVTVQWYTSKATDNVFIWNQRFWNANKIYYILNTAFYLDNTTKWEVWGWDHDTKGGFSTFFLIEKAS